MEKLFIIGTKQVNYYTKDLVEKFLPNKGFKETILRETPLFDGIIEIDTHNKSLKVIKELKAEDIGPRMMLQKAKDLQIAKEYIQGGLKERRAILIQMNKKVEINLIQRLRVSTEISNFVVKSINETAGLYEMICLNDDSVICSINTEENTIIGCIVFYIDESSMKVTVKFNFVDKEFRNQGIFKIMWESLTLKLKDLGIKKINTLVPTSNKIMVKAAKSSGQKSKITNYEYKIK